MIPTLNEGAHLAKALSSVRGDGVEIIVVDGGSEDGTVPLARQAGVRVLESDRGRARQLRAGSEQATGEIVLFLHADTTLETGWLDAVREAMQDPRCAGGAFTFRFSERGLRAYWIEFWVQVRMALWRLPYGDQALFMRREILEQMGGVPIVPVMEDLDLVRGIKRAGELRVLPVAASTSLRRYVGRGAFRTLRTIGAHQYALLGWALGWDRQRIAERMGR
ncbi:MAG: TIGR04283 family arsenosugar biosynthesis glycosyltransferase [Myxococcota bacterium]